MSIRQNSDSITNSFPLPHEVFKLGLQHGALLIYIYLVYCKSLKHCTDNLSYAVIGNAVGLCEKTVRTHLHVLVDNGLIQLSNRDDSFSYTLCPIRDKVQEHSGRDLFPACEGGRSA